MYGGSGTGTILDLPAGPGPVQNDDVNVDVNVNVRSGCWLTLSGMAIHPDLLEILACPVCKTPVEVVKDGAGLRCGQCRRVYPVRDDIPIMLPEEAAVEA